jgi:enoyl-CoA hydratase
MRVAEDTSGVGLRAEVLDGGIHLLTLSRPSRLNALSWELVDALGVTVATLRADPECRAVVLTGAGRGFCSGLDLQRSDDPTGAHDPIVTFMERQERLAALVLALHTLPVPVVAAVNGAAAGGGFALALASDLRVAAESASFVVAFMRAGFSACDMGVSYLLPRLVGAGVAADLLLTGRSVAAGEALSLRLVNRLVADDQLVAQAVALAREITRHAPYGVRMTKEVLAHNVDAPSLSVALALENRTQAVTSRTADHEEAVRALLARRAPVFEGI